MRSGHTKSCGCLHRERAAEQAKSMGLANTSHGSTNTREYEVWHRMKQRCQDKRCPAFPHYGGRGIKVCERWLSFEKFLTDMGLRPSSRHSIDRYPNNDGDYEPSNCRWALPKEQQRNRRSNFPVAYCGKTQCIAAWAEEFGITTLQLWTRLRKMGWPIHEALTLPIARSIVQKKKYKYLRTK